MMSTQPVVAETATATPSQSIPAGANGGADVSFDDFATQTLADTPQEPTPPAAVETPPAATETPEGNAAAAAPAKEAQPVDEWAIDQVALKAAMADPNHGRFVQSLNDKLQASMKFREYFGTIAEARDVKAMIPGGIEELRSIVQTARDAQEENARFMSGKPEEQAAVLDAIAKDNPQAFASAGKEYLRILGQVAPEEFQSTAREFALSALRADGVPEIFSQMFSAANAQDEKAFGEAFSKFHEWAGKAGLAEKTSQSAKSKQVDPETQKLQDRLAKYEEQEKQQRIEKFTSFREAVNGKVETDAKAEITSRIDAVLPKNVPTKIREGLAKRLSEQIWTETLNRMNSDHGHGQKVASILSGDRWLTARDEAVTQVTNLSIGRAKQLIPHIAAEVLNEYTETAVSTANAKTEKELANAQRQDVTGGGVNTPQRPRKLDPKDVRGMSDEDILNL